MLSIIFLLFYLYSLPIPSIETEKTFQSHELFGWVVLVVHTNPVHDALPVEQFQVGSNEDPVLFKCLRANLFAVITVWDDAVDPLFF
jgi:hypothetical protein